MKKKRRKKVSKKVKKEPMRDSMSGLTFEQEMRWQDFMHYLHYGPNYIG